MGTLTITEITIKKCVAECYGIEPRHVSLHFDYNEDHMYITADIAIAETNIDRKQVGKAFTTHDV
tara:strand:+ start:108 stop:302 length:195 start_codon:yes stop_codon:yes gene_type:complete